jgi:hypothetical protein
LKTSRRHVNAQIVTSWRSPRRDCNGGVFVIKPSGVF